MFSRAPSSYLWYIIFLSAIFNATYIHFSNLSVTVDSTNTFIMCALALSLLFGLGIVYSTIRPNTIISTVAYALLFIFLTSFFCGLFSYLTASLALPLNDRLLATIDLAMGFDWLKFLMFVNSYHWLAECLTFLYHTLGFQLLAVIIFLTIAGRHARLNELLGLFLICAIATVMLAAVFPSAGAYAYHKPDASLFAHRSAAAGMWHYNDLMSLREGTMKTIKVLSIEGIVTFPSFHTAVALIIAWALRDYRWLFAFTSVISSLVVVSTLTEGGHYLIDVVAGIFITVAIAWMLHRPFNKSIPSARFSDGRAKPATA